MAVSCLATHLPLTYFPYPKILFIISTPGKLGFFCFLSLTYQKQGYVVFYIKAMETTKKAKPKEQLARRAVRRFFKAADRAIQTVRELEKARTELEALSSTKKEATQR